MARGMKTRAPEAKAIEAGPAVAAIKGPADSAG
jgi:hypothetical protein